MFNGRQTFGNLLFRINIMLLNGHLKKQFRLFYFAPATFPALDDVLKLAKLLLCLLGPVAITPEIRSQGLAFQPFNLFFFFG